MQLLFAGNRQAVRRLKALHLGRLNMQFQHDWPKDKKSYSAFSFLAEIFEKFRSTENYGAPLERSTVFLCRTAQRAATKKNCRSLLSRTIMLRNFSKFSAKKLKEL